ncbi:neuromedin-U receptor 2-like [Gigantopelta aegis]|uniref:neuromedin-U receptor 2-like n=1 Tax=Gigantopelta aegis TaxID=1735272 RepID=UPI001B88B706|nr:neuromedin-U receptor 2-like [Gigantopelta aegis]
MESKSSLVINKTETKPVQIEDEIFKNTSIVTGDSNTTVNFLPIIDKFSYLNKQSDDVALLLLPVLVFLGALMIIGILGNGLVLYVHIAKFKSSSTRNYVIALAILDLLSCCLGLPGEMVDLRFSFTFYSDVLCRVMRVATTFASVASGITLVAVSIDRYCRICRPLKVQISRRGTIKMIVGSCGIAILFTWPTVVIYGTMTVKTGIPGVYGSECSTSDVIKNTKYPIVYNGILFLFFISSFSLMTILYIFIAKKVVSQSKFRQKITESEKPSRSRSLTGSDKMIKLDREPEAHSYADEQQSEYSIASLDPPRKGVIRKSSSFKKFQKTQRDTRMLKTTFMLFLISLVFMLSFLPHVLLKSIRAFNKQFVSQPTTSVLVTYNIFVRSYFINSVANAFIYGFCSPRFRQECQSIFKVLICKRKYNNWFVSGVKQ